MTLYKFGKLNLTQQLLMIDLYGTKLDYRLEGTYHVALFQLGSFYVEAFFPREKIEAEKVVAFNSTHKLQPYLERIDVSFLLQ